MVTNWLTSEGRSLKKRAMGIPTEMLCLAKLGMVDVVQMKGMLDRLMGALLPLPP